VVLGIAGDLVGVVIWVFFDYVCFCWCNRFGGLCCLWFCRVCCRCRVLGFSVYDNLGVLCDFREFCDVWGWYNTQFVRFWWYIIGL